MNNDARPRIIVAAQDLFAQRGFDAVSVRDIAARAGVTHGLLRHYFGSKEGVWRACVEAADRIFRQALMPLVEPAIQGSEDPLADARRLVTALVSVSARHPHLVQVLFGEGLAGGPRLNQITAGLRPLRDACAALLARLHQRGHLAQLDEDGFVVLVLMAAAGPFALAPLVRALTTVDPAASSLAPDAYAEQLAAALFGPAEPPR